MHVQEMIAKHPGFKAEANAALIQCIEECYDCAQTCASCADASLADDDVKMLARCVRFNLDCTDMCAATGAIATRHLVSESAMLREILTACELACRRCEEECLKHARHITPIAAFVPRFARAAAKRARRPSLRSVHRLC
jgi:hypothetical protein